MSAQVPPSASTSVREPSPAGFVRGASATTLLLVDDNTDTLAMYSLWFQTKGYSVFTAKTCREALAVTDTTRPDAVMTDLLLSGGEDGCDLIAELRRGRETRFVPILVLTGWSDRTRTDRAAAAGCIKVLLKPCLPDQLMAELTAAMRSTQES